jgi:ankyrin repeat protein
MKPRTYGAKKSAKTNSSLKHPTPAHSKSEGNLQSLKRKAGVHAKASASLPKPKTTELAVRNGEPAEIAEANVKRVQQYIRTNQYIKVEQALKNGDVSPNAKNPSNGQTLLMAAVQQGQMNICKYLIRKGAKLNGRDNSGRTPIFVAIESEEWDIMEELISCGAKGDLFV